MMSKVDFAHETRACLYYPPYEKQQNIRPWQPYAIYLETPLRALLGRIKVWPVRFQ